MSLRGQCVTRGDSDLMLARGASVNASVRAGDARVMDLLSETAAQRHTWRAKAYQAAVSQPGLQSGASSQIG
jgi:hypothetical protein